MKWKKLRELRLWLQDDWHLLISPGNLETLERDTTAKNLERCKLIVILLLIYEPLSLALMLAGYTQTFTHWYIAPTVLLLATAALMGLYLWVVRERRVRSISTDGKIVYLFFFVVTLAISLMIIGDITQYGQTFLNYQIALIAIAVVPIFRFKRFALLMFLPFLTEMLGLYLILDHIIIIEPIFLFICGLVVGVWLAHTAVGAENNKLDIQKGEEQLRISEESYRLTLEQSGNVFCFFDIPERTVHLPDELARKFHTLNTVANIPESILERGIVEQESIPTVRDLFHRIHTGERKGDALISARLDDAGKTEWYRLSFSTVFDSKRLPVSAIIVSENLTAQHEKELAYQRIVQQMHELRSERCFTFECDLNQGALTRTSDELAPFSIPESWLQSSDIFESIRQSLIDADDWRRFQEFVSPSHLLERYQSGAFSEAAVMKLQHPDTETGGYLKISVQMVTDPYSGSIKAFFVGERVKKEEQQALALQYDIDRLQQELESSRIRAMINQMQPHFLYNALSAIRTIVKTDPDYAYQLIYDFTVHLRSSIKALSSDEPIPFTDELKNIKAYLNIECMRFGERLNVRYEINCDAFLVIPLSIQPLAENAVRHGVYPKGDAGGTVTVRTYEAVDAYVVEVEDDGVGFLMEETLSRKSDSVGLKSLIFRLESLMHAKVKIESEIGRGTKAIVTIPKTAT